MASRYRPCAPSASAALSKNSAVAEDIHATFDQDAGRGVSLALDPRPSRRTATRAMFKIVKRLDPEEECNDLPLKPKGMHWRTYNRLADRYEYYDTQWAHAAIRRFGIKL